MGCAHPRRVVGQIPQALTRSRLTRTPLAFAQEGGDPSPQHLAQPRLVQVTIPAPGHLQDPLGCKVERRWWRFLFANGNPSRWLASIGLVCRGRAGVQHTCFEYHGGVVAVAGCRCRIMVVRLGEVAETKPW